MKEGSPSATAEMVCSWRALENTLPPDQRIVDDPYAAGFLGPMRKRLVDGVARLPVRGRRAMLSQLDQALQGAVNFILARHRAIDDLIFTNPSDQVVLLGAGYDTRPARLSDRLSESLVFEVDHPDTAKRKAELLAKAYGEAELAPTRSVSIDFAHENIEERLCGAGLDRGASTIWVWEGVSMYLHEQAVRETLTMMARLSGPGSQIVCDVLTDSKLAGFLADVQLKALSATMDWFYSEPLIWHCRRGMIVEFFESCGLRVTEDLGLEDLTRPGEERHVGWVGGISPSLRLIVSRPMAGLSGMKSDSA